MAHFHRKPGCHSSLVPFLLCSRKCWDGTYLVTDTQWNLWDFYVYEGVVHGSSLFHLVNIINWVLGKTRKEYKPLKPEEIKYPKYYSHLLNLGVNSKEKDPARSNSSGCLGTYSVDQATKKDPPECWD